MESTAGVALRPSDWRDLGSPPGEHHEHQLDFVENSLSDRLAFESTAGVALRPSDWRDLGSPPGEHHEHQLDSVKNSLSDRLAFESTAGEALRPSDWRFREPAGRASWRAS